jgi:[ribosomal protein S5]-alanine N-acetyltransferase
MRVTAMVWGPNTPKETQAFLREAIVSADVSPRSVLCPCGSSPLRCGEVDRGRSKRLIGSIELRVVSCEHRRGEIGYVLARESWGLGYATEASRRLLAFGFNEHKIFATCDPENRASVAVLPKNGMDQEGVLPSWRL